MIKEANMTNRRVPIIAIVLLSLLMIAAGALSTGTPAISHWVIGGGGGGVSGNQVSLDATLGQPIVSASSGGSIALEAGFWTGAGVGINQVFLPLLSR
jgi:hypothetical protein